MNPEEDLWSSDIMDFTPRVCQRLLRISSNIFKHVFLLVREEKAATRVSRPERARYIEGWAAQTTNLSLLVIADISSLSMASGTGRKGSKGKWNTAKKEKSSANKNNYCMIVFIDQKILSINLQNYKINRPFPRSPSFTVTGNERKCKKTACKSRNNGQFS